MNEFANNDRYEIRVDAAINRMFIVIKGFWSTKGDYLKDLEIACKSMKPNYTLHVDLTTMQTPRADVGEVHVGAQRMLLKYGLLKTAEVHGTDVIAKMALKGYSVKSGMDKENFSSHEDAKNWLDQFNV